MCHSWEMEPISVWLIDQSAKSKEIFQLSPLSIHASQAQMSRAGSSHWELSRVTLRMFPDGALLSSVARHLIDQVLFVTSDLEVTMPCPPTPHPPGRTLPLALFFFLDMFFFFFLLLGVHLCEVRAQRGPVVLHRELGSIKIEPAGQHILALSVPQPDILFHCWTLGEEWETSLCSQITWFSSGGRGGLDVREDGLEGW